MPYTPINSLFSATQDLNKKVVSSGGNNSLSGNITISGTLLVTQDTTVLTSLTCGTDLNIGGDATITGNVEIDSSVTIVENIDIYGNAVVGGTLSSNAIVAESMTVSDNIIIFNTVATNNMTISGIIRSKRDPYPIRIGSNVNISGSLTLSGDLSIGGNNFYTQVSSDLTIYNLPTYYPNVPFVNLTNIDTGSMTVYLDLSNSTSDILTPYSTGLYMLKNPAVFFKVS